jgi:hypothetical protein
MVLYNGVKIVKIVPVHVPSPVLDRLPFPLPSPLHNFFPLPPPVHLPFIPLFSYLLHPHPYPLSLIPYPLSPIPYPLSPIPYPYPHPLTRRRKEKRWGI